MILTLIPSFEAHVYHGSLNLSSDSLIDIPGKKNRGIVFQGGPYNGGETAQKEASLVLRNDYSNAIQVLDISVTRYSLLYSKIITRNA